MVARVELELTEEVAPSGVESCESVVPGIREQRRPTRHHLDRRRLLGDRDQRERAPYAPSVESFEKVAKSLRPTVRPRHVESQLRPDPSRPERCQDRGRVRDGALWGEREPGLGPIGFETLHEKRPLIRSSHRRIQHNGRSMATVEETSQPGKRRVSAEGLREFFREMLLIRRFEEKVEERFRAGELPGFLHVAIGQEAVATGVCAALAREDVIASTHRAHGHTIAKGTPVEKVMAELYGKAEGCSGGYGGSMHLYDVEVGNLGANAVVAGGLPAIVGAALAFQLRSEQRVAVAFLGDGATNTGTFHESLNLAQLWKVPVIFVLENNGWAESTPAVQHLPLPVDKLGKRAVAYGMKLIEADGQDVEAVYLAALAARDHALAGKGPVLLHLRTFRLTGHYVGDPQVYRDRDALKQERETKDPLRLLGARLELSDDEFAAIDAEVTAEVEASVEFAKAGTDPKPEDALKYVYA